MTTATTEETKNVPQDVKEPVKDGADAVAETNNKTENNDKKPAAAEKDDKVAATVAPVEPPLPKFSVKKQNFEKDVVYLYQFSRTPVIPSMSPYCLKVETWLRLSGLKYEASTHFFVIMVHSIRTATLPGWGCCFIFILLFFIHNIIYVCLCDFIWTICLCYHIIMTLF